MLHLKNKTVLITGGSRGLGLAMAHGFADSGANTALASRKEEACLEAARNISEKYGTVSRGYGVHVGHWDELKRLSERVYEDFGRIDVLINNAGMSPLYDSLEDVSEALFDKVCDVNLKGPFRLSSLVGQRMTEDGGGSIINISSTGSVRPRKDIIPYAAAKAGLNAMTIGLAHALGPTVRVNAILAGTFLTDVSKEWDHDAFTRRAADFAAQRGGEPHEIVGAALYLGSDAASYTTGSLLTVDGGQR